MTRMMLTGTYDIPAAECVARSVVTNTVPMVAYRGAGRPEAAAAIERAMDLFAAEIGMDPAEVRRRNLVAADAFPFTTRHRHHLRLRAVRGGPRPRARGRPGYDALRAEQQRRRAAGDVRQLGIGVSVYVEITALQRRRRVRPRRRCSPTARCGSLTGHLALRSGSRHGVGDARQRALGVALDDIEVVHGDTDVVPPASITGGSRSRAARRHQRLAGGRQSSLDQARDLAARLLEADPADIVLDTSSAASTSPARRRSGHGWAELAAASRRDRRRAARPARATSPRPAARSRRAPTSPSSRSTSRPGKVSLQRLVAVDDAGRILNPLLAEGQVHGGLAQGAAQALLEEVVYDDDGNPLTATFADYPAISAAELPTFETVHLETPSPLNELGAKGIGESGRSVPRRRCRTPWSTRWRTSGSPHRHAEHAGAGVAGDPGAT